MTLAFAINTTPLTVEVAFNGRSSPDLKSQFLAICASFGPNDFAPARGRVPRKGPRVIFIYSLVGTTTPTLAVALFLGLGPRLLPIGDATFMLSTCALALIFLSPSEEVIMSGKADA